MTSPSIGVAQSGATWRTPAVPRMARMGVALGAVTISFLLAVAGAPALLAQTRQVCVNEPCGWAQLRPDTAGGLEAAGLSLETWAVCWLAVNLLYVLAFCGVAALIAVKRPDERMAILGCIALASFGATFCELGYALTFSEPAWRLPFQLWSFVAAATLLPFFFLFPNGQFVPRWTRLAIPAWGILSGVAFLSPRDWSVSNSGPWFLPLTLGFQLSVIAAQVYRYSRVSSSLERQQTKWVVAGFATAFGSFFLLLALVVPQTNGADPTSVLAHLAVNIAFPIIQLFIPISMVIAILRYRLWDIDVLVSRALVYGGLTACVVAVYVGVVGYLGAVLHTTENVGVSLAATGVVAVLFQPARERLQRLANRLVYGERDEPYAVLSRLGQRLETVMEPRAIPSTVVSTVRDAFRVPYPALVEQSAGGDRMLAEVGQPVPGLLHLPLTYQGEVLGELRLAARAPGEAWSDTDRRLLDDLARQIGVAVRGLRTLADLQRSRERLVLAREEERRRLRGDLHDDLAPALAALALHADAAGELFERDPPAAVRLLTGLQTALRESVADVRRLAYDLRPPALDDLGLVEAIRERAAQFSGSGSGPVVHVEVPSERPPLPAATEVAAYRIVQEALMNVHRHAAANCCNVRLSIVGGLLELEVSDDGVGLPDTHQPGIGLRSMQERAAELGGWCRIERLTPAGTRVIAHLPVASG